MAADASGGRPWMKWVSLVALVIQTSAVVLAIRYSYISQPENPYLSSTAIVMSELVKLTASLFLVLHECKYNFGSFSDQISSNVFNYHEMFKIFVPSVLYVVQNNLLFAALHFLDAATYQITYQLKIFTTALFSITMLPDRKLSGLKWAALTVLFVGVSLVQIPDNSSLQFSDELWYERVIGFTLVLSACVTSGFCGVYIERILKSTPVSIWVRNMQLATFSVVFGLIGSLYWDNAKISANGFFQGYTQMVWVVVFLSALGGLIIAAVIKYADNILKGFAMSLSVIISGLMSYFILNDFVLTTMFMIGAPLVIVAVFMYSYEPRTATVHVPKGETNV